MPPCSCTERSTNISAPAAPDRVVGEWLHAWERGDIAGTLRHFAEDAVYTLHVDEPALGFAGSSQGKAAIGQALARMREEFDYVLFRPFPQVTEGDRVRMQVEFMYRHRASGEMLTGRFRIVFVVTDGLVSRIEKYHDAERLKAFMRLVASRGGEPAPP